MRIDNSQNILYQQKPLFKSCSRLYKAIDTCGYNKFSQENIYTTTRLFRNHIDWNVFTDYFLTHFKDKNRVKIYSLACSDGSEAYSYAIAISEKIDKTQHNKFFPIFASDIDLEVINAAKSGKINLDRDDFIAIEKFAGTYNQNSSKLTDNKFFKKIGNPLKIKNDKHSEPEYHSIFNPLNSFVPIGNIKNSINFYHSDILTEINKINDDGNSIINTCHVLGYCNKDYVDKVLNTLGTKLQSGSLYVYDSFCNNPIFKNKLKDLGFFFPIETMCFAQKL